MCGKTWTFCEKMKKSSGIDATYFLVAADEFSGRLAQVRSFIKRHNPTIGALTEEVVRDFLRRHLPGGVEVQQGFILSEKGEISPQCDVIIYDRDAYAPVYSINDIVVIPARAVLAVVEVKTTINKSIFHKTIDYFKKLSDVAPAISTYLFIFDSKSTVDINDYLRSYVHPGDYQLWDHDTYPQLPGEIIGIDKTFHLKIAPTVLETDRIGYASWFLKDHEGSEIHALQTFLLSLYRQVECYLSESRGVTIKDDRADYFSMERSQYLEIELFDM